MISTPPLNRVTQVLILGFALVAGLHYARSFLIPFAFGIILAMLVLPVCKKLESWGWKRGWAVLVCILLILAAGAALVGVLLAPVASFNQDLPQLQATFTQKLQQVQEFLARELNIPFEKQQSVLKQGSSALQSVGKYLAGFVTGFFGFLAETVLVLVYVVFFLLNREKYENFVVKLNRENNPDEVRRVLHDVSRVSAKYLVGRLLSILILAVLYTIGLSLLGLKYAVLMGSIAALLTIVPFVGTTLGGLFPLGAALLSGSGTSPLAAFGVILVVQLLDEYFLEPFIVGGEVDISPLAMIVGVVVGGLIWGVAGMILFIPLLGMAKIVFDHVPALRPYGYLLGEEEEGGSGNDYVQKVKKWFKKGKKEKRETGEVEAGGRRR
jgi:predicted PurR-regulated permease PerM